MFLAFLRECREQILLDKRLKILKGCYKVTINSGGAGSVGHGGFALFYNAIGPKTSTTFFFHRSDANLNQVWLYLFLFTQFASFYFKFSLARWDIYFLLIGSIEMCCNGRGFNNGGGGDCRWFPVARRPWIPSVKRSSALFDAQNTGNCISRTIYIYIYNFIYIYSFFFWGGGVYEPIPPPIRKRSLTSSSSTFSVTLSAAAYWKCY